MYYIVIERNRQPYYLHHADDSESRVWTTDREDSFRFHDKEDATFINDKYKCCGVVVQFNDEKPTYDENDRWV